MNKNYDFFMKADMNEYIGKWVAIADQQIIAYGDKVSEVIKTAKSKRPNRRPFVAKVPEKTAMIFHADV